MKIADAYAGKASTHTTGALIRIEHGESTPPSCAGAASPALTGCVVTTLCSG